MLLRSPRQQDVAKAESADAPWAIRVSMYDGLCSQDAASNGRSDTFAHIEGGQAGGISNDKGFLGLEYPLSVLKVITASPRPEFPGFNQPLGGEPMGQLIPMLKNSGALLIQLMMFGTNADIHIAVAFGYIPGIAGKLVVEKPQVAIRIAYSIRKLLLEGNYFVTLLPGIAFTEKRTKDTAAGTAGTH